MCCLKSIYTKLTKNQKAEQPLSVEILATYCIRYQIYLKIGVEPNIRPIQLKIKLIQQSHNTSPGMIPRYH